MINKDFFAALNELEENTRIDKEFFLEVLQTGIAAAYKKECGEAKNIAVKINPEKCTIEVEAYKIIVDGEVTDEEKEISLDDAKKIRSSAKVGEIISEKFSTKDISRVAAQTAKQIIMQKLTDQKKAKINEEMSQKEGEIVTCTVRRIDNDVVYTEISGSPLQGVILKADQLYSDDYKVGKMYRVYVKSIKINSRGDNQVILSRTNNGFIKRLLELEVPEIKAGLVEIKKIVRDAGTRTKVAVYAKDATVDAVGACVGNGGMRMHNIVSELNGEPIDIVPWCEEPAEFIARALSPAKVYAVNLQPNEQKANIIVFDEKEYLRAIGKRGSNAKLAVKLTDWKIDIKKLQDVQTSME